MPDSLPPLVLLPGTLCDDRVFAPLLGALQDQFPALSANVMLTTQHTTLRSAAEHVLAAAPARFALLGFSLGGLLALEIALLAPGRVAGLAMLNVNPAPAPSATHPARRAAVTQANTLGHAAYVRKHLWPLYVASPALQNLDLQELVATMAHDLSDVAFRNQTEAALTRRDYRPLLPTLPMPVLVQAGEHDAVCPLAAQRQLAQALPQATFTVIPQAGHFALLEQPKAVAASIAAWFRTVSQPYQPMQEA